MILYGKIRRRIMAKRRKRKKAKPKTVSTTSVLDANKKEIVQKFLPDKGDFEFSTMQRLADSGLLQGYTYHGMWLTINTMKDLMDARAYLTYEHRKYE